MRNFLCLVGVAFATGGCATLYITEIFDIEWTRDERQWEPLSLHQGISIRVPSELLKRAVVYHELKFQFPIRGEIGKGVFAIHTSINVDTANDAGITKGAQVSGFQEYVRKAGGNMCQSTLYGGCYSYSMPKIGAKVTGQCSSTEFGYFFPSDGMDSVCVYVSKYHGAKPLAAIRKDTALTEREKRLLEGVVRSLRIGRRQGAEQPPGRVR